MTSLKFLNKIGLRFDCLKLTGKMLLKKILSPSPSQIDLPELPNEKDMLPSYFRPPGLKINSFDPTKLYSSEGLKAFEQSWQNALSDPKNHRDDRFCYHVHGLKGALQNTDIMLFQVKHDMGAFDPSQLINLLEKPLDISKKKIISTTVIDQDHLGTWGEVGLILSCPFQNVLEMNVTDAGTNNVAGDDGIEKLKKARKLLKVEDLMNGTSPLAYNDVTITGMMEGREVKVIGFWVKYDEEGQPIKGDLASQIVEHANRLQLPFIKIKVKTKFDDTMPEIWFSSISPNCISVRRNWYEYRVVFWGKNCNEDGSLHGNYNFWRSKGKENWPMSPQDYREFKRIFDKELSFEQKELLKKEHPTFDLDAKFEEFIFAQNNGPVNVSTAITPFSISVLREGSEYYVTFGTEGEGYFYGRTIKGKEAQPPLEMNEEDYQYFKGILDRELTSEQREQITTSLTQKEGIKNILKEKLYSESERKIPSQDFPVETMSLSDADKDPPLPTSILDFGTKPKKD